MGDHGLRHGLAVVGADDQDIGPAAWITRVQTDVHRHLRHPVDQRLGRRALQVDRTDAHAPGPARGIAAARRRDDRIGEDLDRVPQGAAADDLDVVDAGFLSLNRSGGLLRLSHQDQGGKGGGERHDNPH